MALLCRRAGRSPAPFGVFRRGQYHPLSALAWPEGATWAGSLRVADHAAALLLEQVTSLAQRPCSLSQNLDRDGVPCGASSALLLDQHAAGFLCRGMELSQQLVAEAVKEHPPDKVMRTSSLRCVAVAIAEGSAHLAAQLGVVEASMWLEKQNRRRSTTARGEGAKVADQRWLDELVRINQVGLGRIVALYYRSSTLYHIH